MLAPCSPLEALVWHALALVPVRDVSSLYDPRYAAEVRATLPREAWAPVADDAALLGALYERALPASRALHAFASLHDDVPALLAGARWSLRELAPGATRDGALRRQLEALDEALVELLRGALLGCARAFARAYERAQAPLLADAAVALAPLLDEGARALPALRRYELRLGYALGGRGRGVGRVVHVGAPLPWNELDAGWCAVQALHECAVLEGADAARAGAYEEVEWAGLTGLAGALGQARACGSLTSAHERWLAAHALEPLGAWALRAGLATPLEAEALARGDGAERARALRAGAERGLARAAR